MGLITNIKFGLSDPVPPGRPHGHFWIWVLLIILCVWIYSLTLDLDEHKDQGPISEPAIPTPPREARSYDQGFIESFSDQRDSALCGGLHDRGYNPADSRQSRERTSQETGDNQSKARVNGT